MATINSGQAANAYKSIANMAVGKGTDGAGQGADAAGGPSFSELIGEALGNAVEAGYKSEATSAKTLVGKAELTDLVTAIGSAEMALNTVVAVRDRVINAYHDIVKMPI